MGRADTFTLLPLDEYAKILGINPLHFNGARLPGVNPEPFTTTGAEKLQERPVWQQFTWQHTNNISREMVAREIARAEDDIAGFLGYRVAPSWTSQEIQAYPRPYRPEFYGIGTNVRSQLKGIRTRWARVISPGRRNTTLIATATVAGLDLVFSDPNGDGWNTIATITVPTTLTDECEIKLYFANESGAPEWEIRPLKTVSISGGNVTITVDSWLLFDPDVVNRIPTEEVTAIDAGNTGNYITSVEVRREFTDFTQASAQFFWEREPGNLLPFPTACVTCGGTGCTACTLISQEGCLAIRDVENGMVVPAPATFDASTGLWTKVAWTECREPDQVKIWYYSGNQSENGLRGGCDKFDKVLARLVAILATSRLTCRFRAQTAVSDFVEHWRRNLAESGQDTNTIFIPPKYQENPFGTSRGEVYVWNNLSQMRRKRKLRVGVMAA